jgi:hypothetical protein
VGPSKPPKPPPVAQTPTPQDASGAFSDELAALAKRKGFAANLLTGAGGSGLGGQLGGGGAVKAPAVPAGVARLLGVG